MPLTSPPSPASSPPKEQAGTGKGTKRMLYVLLFAVLLIPLIVVWQFINSFLNGTDPTVAGRPLSNPHTHLHLVALGGEPGVIYLGTHYGLFTSTDGGQEWPEPRGVLNTMMILTLAVSPTDPHALAIITRPTSGLGSQGIYFSTDGGRQWHLANNPAGLSPSAYLFTIQAGTASAGHFYAFYEYAGWFETRDMGMHWYPITGGLLSTMQAPSLLTDPGNPNHLFLGGEQGLYESRDDGRHWQHMLPIHGTVLNLVASQTSPRLIFCTTDQGLYRWYESSTANPSITHITALPMSAPPDRLLIDTKGDMLYALAGHDLWSSTDHGVSWQHRFQFDRGDLVSLLLDPLNSQHLYAGFFLPAEVRESRDGGRSWQVLTN